MYPKSFFVAHGIPEEPGTVFVLMPFSAEFSPIFNAIKATIQGASLRMKCFRADDIYSTEPIMESILRGIARAEVIVADVTGRNANVFYELGIAHTVKDRCVILTQSVSDVPFDLKHLRCIEYTNTISGAAELTEALSSAIGQLRRKGRTPAPSGAKIRTAIEHDTYFAQRDRQNAGAKNELARYVVDNLLNEGDSLTLDAGTTCRCVAEEIRAMVSRDPRGGHFSILTHNQAAFEVLAECSRIHGLNLFLAGGRFNWDYGATYGPLTEQAYSAFSPAVAILAASGISANGIYCHGNTEEVALKQCLFRLTCRTRILLADYSKLGVLDGLRVLSVSELLTNAEESVVVTNSPPYGIAENVESRRQECIGALRAAGLRIMEVVSERSG
ncbi:hypothetical protein ACFL5Q_05600 [Planctomycetota bacterium]